MNKKFFKITGRDMRICKPEGKVITFWLASETHEQVLEICEKKGIIDIEEVIDDTHTNPWRKET